MANRTMMRPYISGPMSNIPEHNFPMFFKCEDELRQAGYDPLNPARHDTPGTPESWESCIRRDVADVLEADGIVLLPRWSTSRGACLELVLSVSVGNPVLVWFPGHELAWISDPSLHYDMAIDHLKIRGTISPVDMYNGQRTALY